MTSHPTHPTQAADIRRVDRAKAPRWQRAAPWFWAAWLMLGGASAALAQSTGEGAGAPSAPGAPVVEAVFKPVNPSASAAASAASPVSAASAATAGSDAAASASASEPARAAATPADASASAPVATPAVPEPGISVPMQAPGAPAPAALTEEEEAALRADLWGRVRGGFAMPALDNDLVRKWEQYYGGKPDYVRRMTERGGRYLFHIIEETERRGMPAELALLPFIESAFNPQAMSSARASGMWQFMPGTGRDYRLKQNLFRDDRRSVLASTKAALDYLQSLHRMFGDWQLALAAYNWGQGNVQRAQTRNRLAGLPTHYEALSMPDETRNYVPKLQAIRNIVHNPQGFGLSLPALENHPFFLSVIIDRDIDVALAARLAGMSLDDFLQLNPQMNKPVILAAGTPELLLPFDNAKHFGRELARHRGPLASWTAWVAPRTLKTTEAARTVGMSEATLREINRIPPRMMVKAGSTLLVQRAASSTRDVSEHVAETASMSLSPEPVPLRKVTVRIGRKGESVAALAQRYGVAAALVARWNNVAPGAQFKARQTAVLMLPAGRAAAPRAMAQRAPAKEAVAVKTNSRTSATVERASSRASMAHMKPRATAAARSASRTAKNGRAAVSAPLTKSRVKLARR